MQQKKRDDTATLTAAAHNVSPAYVRMMLSGKRKSREDILNTYNSIIQAKDNLSKHAETAAESAN